MSNMERSRYILELTPKRGGRTGGAEMQTVRAQMMPLQVSDAGYGAIAFGICLLGFVSCLGPVFP